MTRTRDRSPSRRDGLRFSVFVTAQAVSRLLGDRAGRRKAAALLRAFGITKVYLDVFRGYFAPEDVLRAARDHFRDEGFDISGGITTVAGPGCGKPSSRGAYWLCWSAARSQEVVRHASVLAGSLFDEIIVDDFLCTMCRCDECERERRGRDWPRLYREQMVDLARRLIIEPAKEANPNAVVVIKYPQWYDRFHVFGYDVRQQPKHFDLTWAGTETRDPEVEYVQPYQAYFNHRWLRSLAGPRMGGAWFDRINTSPDVFVQQAYQSVLAGAQEIILFDYQHEFFKQSAPHMAALARHRDRLQRLARHLAQRKPVGVQAYKPPDSDGEDEVYIFDYLGMFGIPLVPCNEVLGDATVAFIPRHAASEPGLARQLKRLLGAGATVLITSGLLDQLDDDLRAVFGYGGRPTAKRDDWTFRFRVEEREAHGPGFVHFVEQLNPATAHLLASAIADDGAFPILTEKSGPRGAKLMTLSAHTMRYAPDSPRVTVGEPVPLIHLPGEVVQAMRARLLKPLGIRLEMPSLVGFYPFAGGPVVFENFGRREARVTLSLGARQWGRVSALAGIFDRRRLRPDRTGAFCFALAPQEVAAFRLVRPRS
jgi:hypothetical protein